MSRKIKTDFFVYWAIYKKRRASPILSTLSCPPKIHKFDCQFSFLVFLRNICQATVTVNRLWVVLHPDGMPHSSVWSTTSEIFSHLLQEFKSVLGIQDVDWEAKIPKLLVVEGLFDFFSTLLCCFSFCNKRDRKTSEQSITSFLIDTYAWNPVSGKHSCQCHTVAETLMVVAETRRCWQVQGKLPRELSTAEDYASELNLGQVQTEGSIHWMVWGTPGLVASSQRCHSWTTANENEQLKYWWKKRF